MKWLALLFPFYLLASPYSHHISTSLFNEVNKEGQNCLISPYTIENSLLLMYSGATQLSKYELKRFLKINELPNIAALKERLQDAKLVSHNMLWLDQPHQVDETFIGKEEVETINLSNRQIASQRIEEWVSQKSKRKLSQLFKDNPFKPTSHSLLTDLATLKSHWKYPFRLKDSFDDAFFSEGSPRVNYMCQTADHLYYEDGKRKIVSIPLENDLSILFYMDEKLPTQLFDLSLLNQMEPTKVYVQLPKFNHASCTQMNRALMSLGILKPFFRGAQFGNITPDSSFYISDVIHQSRLTLNEWGIDGASSLFTLTRDYKPPSTDASHHFIANRPFLYLIIDSKEDIILFVGTYCHPEG